MSLLRAQGLAACAFVALFLAACAGQPAVPFDRASASKVKTIGLLTPRIPDGPSVELASTVGRSLGLVGALVDAGMQANRDSRFKQLLQQQGFAAREEFVSRLRVTLEQQGYRIQNVAVARADGDFLTTYPRAAGVDAYLDVIVSSYGYIAAGIGDSTPYRPGVSLKLKLVSPDGKTVLMQDAIVYNAVRRDAKAVTIAPNPSYQFVDFDALVAAPQQATEGMRAAVNETVATVGTLLK